MIYIVCLHILRMHVRCRESRSYGDFNACFDPRAKLIMCAANSVLTFHVSSPRPLKKSVSSLRLCLFHCLLFSVLPHGFERRRTCSYCYISAPFVIFFLTQVFTPFQICASLFFLLPLVPSFFFSSQFSFIPIFTRTSFIALNFILLRFIGRDYLLVCFSFHSSQSPRNVWLLTTHIPRYSPIVVVIMRIMSTLGWCPLKVISSEISVFLSIDS